MRNFRIYLCLLLLALTGSLTASAQRTYIRLRCTAANDACLIIKSDATIGILASGSLSADCNTHCNWADVPSGNGHLIYQIINGKEIYLKGTPQGMTLTAESSEATVFSYNSTYNPVFFYSNNQRYFPKYTDHLYVTNNDEWVNPITIVPIENEGVRIDKDNFEGVTIENFPLTQTQEKQYVILKNDGSDYIAHNGTNVSVMTSFSPEVCIWTSTANLTNGATIGSTERQALSFKVSGTTYTLSGQGGSINTSDYKIWAVTETRKNAGSDRITLTVSLPSGNSNMYAGESKELSVNASGSVTPAATDYEFANAHHYYTDGGTYLGNSQTITYDSPLIGASWSKSGDTGSNTSLSGTSKTGATLNYNTDCSEQRNVNVRITASSPVFANDIYAEYRITLMSLASIGSGNYVFYASDRYLKNDNGTIVSATTFDPATCIWTASGSNGSLTFSNSGKYLISDNGDISLGNTADTWTLRSAQGGIPTMDGYYLRLAGTTWALSSDAGSSCAYIVTTTTKNTPQMTEPVISGNTDIGGTGTFNYTHSNASYIPPYTDYEFGGTHHYFCTQTGLADSQSAPQSVPFTYTWSLSANASGHMSVNGSGTVSYTTAFEENTQVTLTLTATSVPKTFTATKTIRIQTSLGDMYCYIRNESHQYGQNNPNAGDYYLTTSNNTYNNSYNYICQKADPSANEIWLLRKYDDSYFQIIHATDQRYVITKANVNDYFQAFYLSESALQENNDINNSLFIIGKCDNGNWYIQPKSVENQNLSWNARSWGTEDMSMYAYQGTDDAGSRWILEQQEYTPVKEGVWHIQNAVDNGSYIVTDNTRAYLADGSADNMPSTSYWTLKRNGNVYYQLVSQDGRYLTVGNMTANSTTDGSNSTVLTSSPGNIDQTLFRIGSTGDGNYCIVPKLAGRNMSLTSYSDKTRTIGWRYWGGDYGRAKWKFIEPKGASAGKYVIENNGKYLANVNGTVTAVSDFNPATCIWTATGSGGNLSFTNGGKYLTDSNGTVTLSSSAFAWNVNKSVSGSIKSGSSFLHVSGDNWVVDGTTAESAYIITASNTESIGSEPAITTGPSTISATGSFQYGYTPATYINAHSYTWNGTEHFVSPDGLTWYGTVKPQSETFTYTWSVSGNAQGYMTVTDAGLLKYENEFESPTSVTLTLTAQSASKKYTATKQISISVAGYCAPAGKYVLYSGEHFLRNNYGIQATTDFSPGSCIWTATATEQNGRNCLYFENNGTRLNINGNQYWIVNDDSEGYLQALGSENVFLAYNPQNNSWNTGNTPDGCAFAVSGPTYHDNLNTNPTIDTEETEFSELRSYKFFISTPAQIIEAYDEYVLKDGPHLYVRNNVFIGINKPETELFLYTWSIDDATGHTTVDQNGNLTYNQSFASNTQVKVTLTAKRSKDNSTRSASKEVTMKVAESSYINAKYEDLYCYIINHGEDPNSTTKYYLYPSSDGYHLRTHNSNDGNAVWILRKFNDESYQLIHAATGKYVIANSTSQGAQAVHLEANANNLTYSLFELGEIVMDQYGYYIRPKSSVVNEEYGLSFNPFNGNGNDIGLYPVKDGNHNKIGGSMWFIQEAKVATPIIMAEDGKISITTTTAGAEIHYTTDGSTPTKSSPLYTGPFEFQDGNTIKAIGISNDYLDSEIATQKIHMISSLSEIPDDGADGYYVLTTDIEAPAGYTTKTNFTGVFDGGYHTISGLDAPLFYNTVDAIVKNVRLDNVNITGTGNLGAITCLAKGRTVIINCGVLASQSSVIKGGSNVGSIAGQIENKSRVVNCYSFASVQGTTAGGIVGSNSGTASVIDDIRTMVMNCIFYGDIDGTHISPVYGGTAIENRNNINTYTFYQAFDNEGNIKFSATDVDNSMPVTDNSYLDRFEFYRNMLNSHRELAAFYAFDDHTRLDQIGKWILEPAVAPYPIVSTWKTHTRKTLDRVIPNTTNAMQGRQLGTIPVTFVIQGQNKTITRTYDLPITDMDTARWDFTANKIVLPFANEIYPEDPTWRPRVPDSQDEFKSMIITGWECTSISGGTVGSKQTDYDGDGTGRDYNFADPDCTAKDIFDISGANSRDSNGSRDASFNPFVYAQGGNFVVPTDATAMTFTAHWATCVYLSDAGEDVAYNPEFTESTQIGSYSWENRTETIVSSSFRDVSYRDGWTVTTTPATDGYPDGQGERWDNLNDFLEFYRFDGQHSFSIIQEVKDMEPGTYMLRFYGFSRHGDYALNNQAKTYNNMYGTHSYIYAKQNGVELGKDTLKSVYDHTAQEVNAVMEGFDAFNANAQNNLDGYVHSLSAAKIAFNHGYYMNEMIFEVTTKGNVEIGIYSDLMPANSWATFRDMRLYKLIDDKFTDSFYQEKKVVHNITDAMSKMAENEIPNNQAIVLVGNYHLNDRIIGNSFAQGTGALSLDKALTFMSTDDNFDQEPDYCMYMYTSNPTGISRTDTPPLRFDFLTCPGIGMAARVSGSSAVPGIGIWHTRGWYETTETYLGVHSEAEINPSYKQDRWMSPWIINGGIYDRIICNFDGERNLNTNNNAYIRLGGSALIRQFHPGNHDDKNYTTYLVPVNVSGGEIEQCYMTGREGSTSAPKTSGNVQFWSNGGYIHEFLGAYMAPVNGNVTAKIDHAIFDNFYGGGMNANQPVKGNIDVEINNSLVKYYVGGPKVGDMEQNTSVTTSAKGTTFGSYFGGGYGGTSTARRTVYNETVGVEVSISDDLPYPVGFASYSGRRLKYEQGYGIATGYGFEYFFEAGGQGNLISRFFVDYSSLSLATVRNVSNTLEECSILNDFYGGGRQGYVNGNVTSTLSDCTVSGSAFAGGYTGRYKETPVATATKPEYSTYLFHMGVFTPFGKTENETYHWEQVPTLDSYSNANTKALFTTTDMSLMGKVNGNTSLTVEGKTMIEGSVFGGGNQADVNGSTNVVIVSDDTEIAGTVFGGGNESNVTKDTGQASGNTRVTITGGSIAGDVFGGGNKGNVEGNPHVTVGQE